MKYIIITALIVMSFGCKKKDQISPEVNSHPERYIEFTAKGRSMILPQDRVKYIIIDSLKVFQIGNFYFLDPIRIGLTIRLPNVTKKFNGQIPNGPYYPTDSFIFEIVFKDTATYSMKYPYSGFLLSIDYNDSNKRMKGVFNGYLFNESNKKDSIYISNGKFDFDYYLY